MDKRIVLWTAIWASALVAISIIIPGILVKKSEGNYNLQVRTDPEIALEAEKKPIIIPVYLTQEKRIERVALEHYVRGVLAAEMPVEFELEALKAQAIAARTYIIRRIAERDFSQVPVQEAWVTDTIVHQAYLTDKQLKGKWGLFEYAANMDKLNRAVNETKGMIITYADKPIVASFFSTSNGYTENSEDYWSEYIPYLRSVPSPWDRSISPKYQETVSMNYSDFLGKLGLSGVTAVSTGNSEIRIIEKTEGNRIKKVTIGGKIFTGREVREKLGINSSQFTWKRDGSKIEFTTFGYGHGVGMSQWGANGMAKEGKNAAEILTYYYKGVSLQQISTAERKGLAASVAGLPYRGL